MPSQYYTCITNLKRLALYHKSNREIDQEFKLIKAAQKDPAMFSPLYHRYYAQIRAFVYRRVQDEQVASDITSQVFLKTLHHLPKYKFKGVPFAAFLYRIASNEVNLEFRKTKGQQNLYLPQDKIPEIIDDSHLELKETKDTDLMLLKKALEKLSSAEVELIEMYYFQDMSFKEVGAFLGITENNAKVKTKRLRDKLKKIIERLKEINE